MNNKTIKNVVTAAMLLALGVVLPLFTGQIKEIGDTLLPMHIPVLLCGLIVGAKYGFLIGLILPFLRSIIFGMPPIYPSAVWLALELCTYGAVIGILYSILRKKGIVGVYISLVSAMISGRVVWGIAKAVLLGVGEGKFTFAAFIAGGFVDSLLGIIIQLLLIPAVMALINYRLGHTNK